MSSKLPPLITAEEASEYQSWALPGFDGSGNVLPTAEKEAKDRKAESDQVAGQEASTPDNAAEPAVSPEEAPVESSEIIEDVDAEDVSFSPITAEELQAITDAAEQEGFAKGKAEGVVSGHKEGLDRGYQEGLKKAELEATKKLNEQVAHLQSVAQSLMQPIAEQGHQLERLLVDFTCALTANLVERELTTDSSQILSAVKKALAALPVGAESITLYLNPDDLALVESYAEKQHESWRFVGDAELLPGGCRVKTDSSLVDYSVETRMAEMLQQFKNKQLVGDDDGSQFDYPEPEQPLEEQPELLGEQPELLGEQPENLHEEKSDGEGVVSQESEAIAEQQTASEKPAEPDQDSPDEPV